MTPQCTLYVFNCPTAPWGIIQVAVRFAKDDPWETMINFPSRYLYDHPECTELESIVGVGYLEVNNE